VGFVDGARAANLCLNLTDGFLDHIENLPAAKNSARLTGLR